MSETRKCRRIQPALAPEGPLRIRHALSRSAFSRAVIQIAPTRPRACLGLLFGSRDVLDRPPCHASRAFATSMRSPVDGLREQLECRIAKRSVAASTIERRTRISRFDDESARCCAFEYEDAAEVQLSSRPGPQPF